jgi:hypothetical protein
MTNISVTPQLQNTAETFKHKYRREKGKRACLFFTRGGVAVPEKNLRPAFGAREGGRCRVVTRRAPHPSGINPEGSVVASEWRHLRVREVRRSGGRPLRLAFGAREGTRRPRRHHVGVAAYESDGQKKRKKKEKSQRQRAKRTDVKMHLERHTLERRGTLSVSRLQRGRGSAAALRRCHAVATSSSRSRTLAVAAREWG